MERYVLRDGQTISTDTPPHGLEVYTYSVGYQKTHLLLSDKAEVAFLLMMGREADVRFSQ